MKAGSLRLRLLVAAAISISAALFVAGLALDSLFEQQVRTRVMQELTNDLLQLAGSIDVSETGTVSVTQTLADPRFQKPYGGKYWYIDELTPVKTRHVLRSRSMWDSDASGDIGPEGEQLVSTERTITIRNKAGDVALRLVVSTHGSEISLPLSAFRNQLTLYLSLIGLALTVAAWLQVSIGLKPLQALREQLALLGTSHSKRLTGEFPTEVEPLVSELNNVLDLRDKSLERARHRAGDLAHGLMTPLTILSAIARKVPKRGAEIEEQIDTMHAHVERSLMRARLASGRGHDLTGLAAAVDAVFATVKKLPRGDEIQWLNGVAADVVVPLERSDLLELLGNLLDNARKFTTSRVQVSYLLDHIVVEDDGPGVEAGEIETIRQRGHRLDESRQGFGLGLAIVEDIANLYQLELSFERSSLGGLLIKLGVKP